MKLESNESKDVANYTDSEKDNEISTNLWLLGCNLSFIDLIRQLIIRELTWMKINDNQ